MKRSHQPSATSKLDLSRRNFVRASAGAGALLALAPERISAERSDRGPRARTLFLNLAHEDHRGQQYFLYIAGERYPLQTLAESSAAARQELQRSRFLSSIPADQITHVVEKVILPSNQVLMSYVIKNPDTSTGKWQMSCIYLLPPLEGLAFAYKQARALAGDLQALPLSAKRAQYGLQPASTYTDIVEEHALLDSNDWGAALINVHPELLSADADSAAHVQYNYINADGRLPELAYELRTAGPAQPQTGTEENSTGWATLVPHTDQNGAPLVSENPQARNKGLILYDTQWNTRLKSTITAVTNNALLKTKNDTLLGVNIAETGAGSKRGALWTRTDGQTAIDQAANAALQPGSGNVQFALTNITPNFQGYNCVLQTSGTSVTLKATNWYLRYLAFYLQFLNGEQVVQTTQLPAGVVPADNPLITANQEILIQQISPEFTIFGVPISPSSASYTFDFPAQAATSARIIASGLGVGRHLAEDTELVGIVMTSLFNFILPTSLLVMGAAISLDIFVSTVAIPLGLTAAQEVAALVTGSGGASIGTIFWRALVKGASKGLLAFQKAFLEFLIEYAASDIVEDSIPIVGSIIQAVGIAGTLAELGTSTAETLLSPKSYIYELTGTYDLTISIKTNDAEGFPATAATYRVTAGFDNAAPHTGTYNVPQGSPASLAVTFQAVPLGGNVTISVGFYAEDGTLVANGSAGPLVSQPSTSPVITVTTIPFAINASTVYQHKQAITLDAEGNHIWTCAPAPPAPNGISACAEQVGSICQYRDISVSTTTANIGYGWQSFIKDGCNGGSGQLDQVANLKIANEGTNVQSSYAHLQCGLSGTTKLAYDPLGRANSSFYLDASENGNFLRQVSLSPPSFQDPTDGLAWGKFTFGTDDLLLHPGGAVLSINQTHNRFESLRIPTAPQPDAQATTNLVADLHGGFGSRPGLFSSPILATVTADGVVLVVEQGNNRIHAVDAAGNPVKYFPGQPVPYFLVMNETGSDSLYLDVAAEYSGLIYLLSMQNSVYRLDIYDPKRASTTPLCTTHNLNAARIAVDYWRNLYSLNYIALVHDQITQPQISQWIPTTPPSCTADRPRQQTMRPSARVFRRRDLLLPRL